MASAAKELQNMASRKPATTKSTKTTTEKPKATRTPKEPKPKVEKTPADRSAAAKVAAETRSAARKEVLPEGFITMQEASEILNVSHPSRVRYYCTRIEQDGSPTLPHYTAEGYKGIFVKKAEVDALAARLKEGRLPRPGGQARRLDDFANLTPREPKAATEKTEKVEKPKAPAKAPASKKPTTKAKTAA